MRSRQKSEKRKEPSSPALVGCLVLWTLLQALPASLRAQAIIHPAEGESSVQFTIRNFGVNVTGTLGGLNGEIVFDPQQLASARFAVSLKSATIQTGNKLRDDHLKKTDYLDVTSFPEIVFRSTAVRQGQTTETYLLSGILTIKGISKTVEIPFQVERYGPGYRFIGTFRINRQDFKVGGYSISLSDNLTISLRIIGR